MPLRPKLAFQGSEVIQLRISTTVNTTVNKYRSSSIAAQSDVGMRGSYSELFFCSQVPWPSCEVSWETWVGFLQVWYALCYVWFSLLKREKYVSVFSFLNVFLASGFASSAPSDLRGKPLNKRFTIHRYFSPTNASTKHFIGIFFFGAKNSAKKGASPTGYKEKVCTLYRVSQKKCPIATFSLNLFQRSDYSFSHVFRNQNFEPVPS